MYCPNCGAENPQTAKFCIQCGGALAQAVSPSTSQRQRIRPLWQSPAYVVVAVVVAAGIIAVLLFSFTRPGKHLFLGTVERNGDTSLYLVKLGQAPEDGVSLARDIQDASGASFQRYDKEGGERKVASPYGYFVPETNHLVYWYADNRDVTVQAIRVGKKVPAELIRSGGLPLMGTFWSDSDLVFLQEMRGNQARCYGARGIQPAERLAKGDQCWISANSSTVFFTDVRGGETTLSSVSSNGKNEQVLFEGLGDVLSIKSSDDGSHVAYVQATDDGQRLYIAARRGGTPVEASDLQYAFADYVFMPGKDVLYYVAESDEGLLQLSTSDEPIPVAEGTTMNAIASRDGRYLVYASGERDNEVSVYVRPAKGGQSALILTGETLQYSMLPSSGRLLLWEQDRGDLVLYTADLRRAKTTELFREDRVSLAALHYAPSSSRLYAILREEQGTLSLFATPVDRAEGWLVLDRWARIELLNESRNGHQLVFSGQEDPGDIVTLYAVSIDEYGAIVELDDDHESFGDAVLAPNGKSVIYTALNWGDVTDIDVFSVPLDGTEPPSVLYRTAFLGDVQWDELRPFGAISWQPMRRSTSFCPGAPAIAAGDSVSGKLETGGQACYRFRASEGDLLTFDVDTPKSQRYDGTLTLHDRRGQTLTQSNSGPDGPDPRLTTQLEASGVYHIVLSGRGQVQPADYELTAWQGPGDRGFLDAKLLRPSSRTRGSITGESRRTLETYHSEVYGDVYFFDGERGDRVTIDVFAEPIGSQLDPQLTLFDMRLGRLAYDDNSGSGRDARITYTLREAGRHYVLITDANQGYGDADTYFYEVFLTVQ